jgi:hypothetical protein
MSKAIYKFDLSDPDDQEEFLRTTKATNMASALWEITQNTRKTAEYEFDFRAEQGRDDVQPQDVIDYIYDRIFAIMQQEDINLDVIYR